MFYRKNNVILLSVLLSLGIFLIDIYVPLGYSIWLMHLVPLFLVSWNAGKKTIGVFTAFQILLIVVGFFLSPPGAPMRYALFNTALCIVVIVAGAFFMVHRRWMLEELIRATSEKEEEARKAAEHELSVLEAFLENIPDIVVVSDANANVRFVSRYGCELMGWKKEDFQKLSLAQRPGHAWILEVDGKTPARREELPLMRAARGEVVRDIEYVLAAPGGEKIPVLINAGPVKDKDGRVVGGIVIDRNISDYKKALRAVVEIEDTLRRFFEKISDGILIVSHEGRIINANTAACAMLGYTCAELSLRGMDDVFDPEDPRVRGIFDSKAIKGCELDARLKDGTAVRVEVSFTPISRASGGDYAGILMRDLSERKAAAAGPACMVTF